MAKRDGLSFSSDVSGGDQIEASDPNNLGSDVRAMRQIDLTAGEAVNGDTSGPQAVYQDPSDNEFYLADANDTSKMKFIGFGITDGTDGNALTVQFHGIVSGFSSLAEGEKYYLQDTAGSIGNTPGTNEILVGIAVSTTQLLILRGQRRASGIINPSGTSDDNTTITLGFRPSAVFVYGVASDTSAETLWVSQGAWTASDGNSVAHHGFQTSAAQSGGDDTSLCYRLEDGNGNGHEGAVDNVDDTSFRFNDTYFGSVNSPDIRIQWVAIGEL